MKNKFKKAKGHKRKSRIFSWLLNLAPKPSTPLKSGSNRPLELSFEKQFKLLIYYHLEGFQSGRDLLQATRSNPITKLCLGTEKGIKKSTFFDALNSRGLEQLTEIFEGLCRQAGLGIAGEFGQLGELIAIDGSLLDLSPSMQWGEYRKTANKAKLHLGFSVNRRIPTSLTITDGKKGEGEFVEMLLSPGQTGVTDRFYQKHEHFDLWQGQGKNFACRIKKNTTKEVIAPLPFDEKSIVFYDAITKLGSSRRNQTQIPVRVTGYEVDATEYWIASNRFDLKAEEISEIYRLRWRIETFFGWWKRHFKIDHALARTEYGFKVQVISSLIAYLLLALYCAETRGEPVSIDGLRSLSNQIANELIAPVKIRKSRHQHFKQKAAIF